MAYEKLIDDVDSLLRRALEAAFFNEKSVYFSAAIRKLLIEEGWKPEKPHVR